MFVLRLWWGMRKPQGSFTKYKQKYQIQTPVLDCSSHVGVRLYCTTRPETFENEINNLLFGLVPVLICPLFCTEECKMFVEVKVGDSILSGRY
jgi:hypothetical protein